MPAIGRVNKKMRTIKIIFGRRPMAVFGFIYMGHYQDIDASNIIARSRNIITHFMIIAGSSNIIAPKQHYCFWL
jgi:hypothetical protein